MSLMKIIETAEKQHKLEKDEIVALLENSDCDQAITIAADRVRKQYVGDEVHLRGLIEFSNICRQNCFYCGLRAENGAVKRYRLETDEILELARKAKGYGYKTLVLQSGEDTSFTVQKLTDIISRIKKLDMAITLSIGEKSREEYCAYKEAGADRYLLRIETTDSQLYQKLHPHMSLENRKQCLYTLKELGYEVGTGCLVGLPGQTLESLADDILFFQELDTDMIGLGPFIPHQSTPLKNEVGGTFAMAIKVMAIVRLLLPDSNIPATTAMETLNSKGRLIALQSGANVVMPNVTEGDYRKMYELYPGKICVNDTPAHCRSCITGKISSIGRTVSQEYGFRKRKVTTNN
ncbi:[FeFe] hydrogenase maturase subunit HydE [bioreactor metagenome]|uniref:[FeFe] hydrogenase maturase subunit HydE n=1 Tax=bioreactor metagenome TaxID=1076179 RepID=A0A644TGV2_9ZZZZ